MEMPTEERHQEILNLLNKYQTVSLKQLLDCLNVSESTIRRDLSQLEEESKLIRVHGGAKKNVTLDAEQTITEKAFKNSHEKDQIAKYAASLVKENETIYLDAGTTTYAMVPYLKDKNILVVTNGIQSANRLVDMNIDTILLGGKIKQTTKAIIGSFTLKQFEQYRFSKAFLGINGIDLDAGLTTPDNEEAMLKQAAMDSGNEVYFLADSSKFNKVTFCKVAELEGQKIITSQTDEQVINKFKNIASIKEVKE